MNAIEILGSILGRRAQSSGGRIARDVIREQKPKAKVERQAPPPRRQPDYEPETDYQLPAEGASDLEDLMRDAYHNFDRKTGGEYRESLPEVDSRAQRRSPGRQPAPQAPRPEPRPEPRSFGREPRSFDEPSHHSNQQATLLIRAMVLAAKADGRIDQAEQDQIVGELGGQLDREQVEFLREEFASPLDLRSFLRSVPRGMEHNVYVASLMAIDLDSNPEAQHLHELAQALGISPEECNRIHRQFDAPPLY
ncbi:MAG: DUF533 domain-containing protein [Planctomycetales bacterium]|nr:DUF533 domain-containing protein [Planctomycetales bacterium]